MIQYARGRTPRDFNHIDIYDGMGHIEEGTYSLKTLGKYGWEIININGWNLDVANVLLMRKNVRSESVGTSSHDRELWAVEGISEVTTVEETEVAVGSVR